MALIIDTGPLYAAYDRRDDDHRQCRDLLASTREELLVPAPVVVEFDYLTISRKIPQTSLVLMEDISRGAYKVVDLIIDDYARAGELMEQYDDTPIGFVDAAVFAVVERLRESKLATLDRKHFGIMRPRHVGFLQLLPG